MLQKKYFLSLLYTSQAKNTALTLRFELEKSRTLKLFFLLNAYH